MSHNASIPHRLIGQDAPPAPSLGRATFTVLWSPINGLLEWFGQLGLFSWQVLRAAVRRPFEGQELLRQFDEVGSKSLPLVALAGAARFRALLGKPQQPGSLWRPGHASRRSGVLHHPRNRPDRNRPGGQRQGGRRPRRGIGLHESNRTNRCHGGLGGILALFVSSESAFLTIFVLISQNRMARPAERRSHLDLQVGMHAEQELTTVLQMLQKTLPARRRRRQILTASPGLQRDYRRA